MAILLTEPTPEAVRIATGILWRRAGFTALLVTHDIEEALLLASRVVALTDRPARIKRIFNVDKSYPRQRDDADLIGMRGRILATLGIERPA